MLQIIPGRFHIYLIILDKLYKLRYIYNKDNNIKYYGKQKKTI